MPNSKIYFGKIKVRNIKFGTKDLKVFYGKHKNYPTSVSIEDAEVTCNSAIYNGSKQVASNIVVVFSGITLVEGIDYTVTKNLGGTNVGTYEIEVTGTGEDYEGTASGTFTINKVTPTVTAPTAKSGLIYNGSAQALANAASTNWGTLKYSLDGSTYTTSIPEGINATSYTIYYKVDGDSNINNVLASSISNSIAKVTPTVTAPTAKSGLIYSGAAQALATAGSTNWGTLQYSLDNSSYSTSIPSGTNATSYDVYYRVVGDSNINDVAANTISVSIAKADAEYTAPTAKNTTYNTSAQTLLNAGSTSHGTIQYSSDNSTWGTAIPSGTNANTYTSYWRIIGDANHNDKASASISTTISPKTVSSPTITLSQDTYTYSNTACQPTPTVKDGSVTIVSSEYTVSYSDNINAGTATCTITDKTGGNYTVSGSKTFTINKVTPTVTAPTPKTLTFNTENQVLANAGSTNWGTIQYCLNNSGGTYSTTVPSASAANVTYKVWYKVVGNSNINDVAPASIDCMIAEKRVTTPTIVLDPSSYTYNGSARTPNVTVKDGTTVIPASEYTKTFSNNTNAGTATVTITDNTAGNYYISGTTTFTINKANGSVTTAPTAKSLTYNNTAQQLINAGSGTGTMMYKLDSGSWSTSIPTATNATSYTVYYKASASTNYNESTSGSVSVTINKVTPTVTAPTAKSLTYNGSAQQLANAGSTNWGTIQYCSTSGGTYSASIPSGTNATSYEVWYKVVGNSNVNDVAAAKITVNIAKANPTYTAPTANNRTYDTTSKALLNAGSTSHGTIQYSSNNSTWSTTIPTGTTAGSYTSYWRLVGDSNHNDVASTPISTTIAKANGSVTINGVSLTYNGSARNLATVNNNTGTMHYSTNGTSWSTNIPTGINATAYTVYWYMDASTNYNAIASASTRYVSSTIAKANQSAPTASVTAATYPGTSSASATGGGGQGTLTWTNGSSRSAVGTQDTYAYWAGNSNYNASPNSNKVTLSVSKFTPTVTLAATDRAYNGNALYATASVATPSGGAATKGTIYYGTTSGAQTYSVTYGGSGSVNLSSVSVTNVGSATVYAYFVPDSSCNGYYNNSGNVSKTFTVSKANQSAPTATGATVAFHNTATATASGGGGQGTLTWTNGNTRTATGTTTTAAYWSGNGNYNASPNSNSVSLVVNKATDQSVTVTLTNRTYSTSAQVVASATSHGCTFYLGFGASSTSAPTSWGAANSSISQTNAGTYYVWYKGTADGNHSADISATYKGTVSIGKADQSAPSATGATTTYPTAATAKASGGGGVGSIEWESAQSQSSVGSHTTRARWTGNGNYNASPWSNSVTVQMNQAGGSVTTAPANNNYTYNGTARAVASAGSGTGTMYYRLGTSGSFSTTMPTMTNAGSSTLYYYAAASTNYTQSSTGSITVSVQRANISPTVSMVGWTYGGTASNPSVAGNSGSGSVTYYYKVSGAADSTYTTTKPSNAGTYIIRADIAVTTNYNSGSCTNSFTIAKASPSYTAPTANNRTYDGTSKALLNAGSTSHGTIYYSANNSSWSTAIPSGSTAGSYTTYWKITGDSNHTDKASASIGTTISKANISPSVSMAGWTYGGTPTNPSVAGNSGSGTVTYYYKLSTESSWTTTKPTSSSNAGTYNVRADIAATTNYNSGSCSSSFTIAKAQGTVNIEGRTTQYCDGCWHAVVSYTGNTGTIWVRFWDWDPFTKDNYTANPDTYTDHKVYWYMDESTNYTGIPSATTRYVLYNCEDQFIRHVSYDTIVAVRPGDLSNSYWHNYTDYYVCDGYHDVITPNGNLFHIENVNVSTNQYSSYRQLYVNFDFVLNYPYNSDNSYNKIGEKHMMHIEYDQYASGQKNYTETDLGWSDYYFTEVINDFHFSQCYTTMPNKTYGCTWSREHIIEEMHPYDNDYDCVGFNWYNEYLPNYWGSSPWILDMNISYNAPEAHPYSYTWTLDTESGVMQQYPNCFDGSECSHPWGFALLPNGWGNIDCDYIIAWNNIGDLRDST